MPWTNSGLPLSVVRISVFLEVSQMGYRYRVVPYRLWRFCATWERYYNNSVDYWYAFLRAGETMESIQISVRDVIWDFPGFKIIMMMGADSTLLLFILSPSFFFTKSSMSNLSLSTSSGPTFFMVSLSCVWLGTLSLSNAHRPRALPLRMETVPTILGSLLNNCPWFWLISRWKHGAPCLHQRICMRGLDNFFLYSICNISFIGMPSDAHCCMCFVSSSPNFFLEGRRWLESLGSNLCLTWFLHEPCVSPFHHCFNRTSFGVQIPGTQLQPGVLKRNMPNFSIFPAPFECIIFRKSSDESCAKRSSKLGWISLEGKASCITSWKYPSGSETNRLIYLDEGWWGWWGWIGHTHKHKSERNSLHLVCLQEDTEKEQHDHTTQRPPLV